MLQTLMVGLTEKDMQAVVKTYNFNPFYWPTLFPLKQNLTLSWKALEKQAGVRIAADIVARGASLDKKTREALNRLQGDIPKIAIKRTKEEDELNEYDIMVALAGNNPDLRALVEAWAEDTQFCWDGVAARLEWIALQSISLGKVTLTSDNNAGPLSEFNADYAIDAARKKGYQTGSASWDNTSAKPITKDFRAIVKAARAEQINLRYAFMNAATFAKFAECEEVIKLSASFAQNVLGVAYTPTVESVNEALKRLAYLYGLQIIVIDQQITIEKKDGERITANPFADDVVLFSEDKILGNTFYTIPADFKLKGSAAIKALNGPVCIKKYSLEEPICEVTQGIANAFPAWLASGRSFLMDVTHSSWTH